MRLRAALRDALADAAALRQALVEARGERALRGSAAAELACAREEAASLRREHANFVALVARLEPSFSTCTSTGPMRRRCGI